MRKSHNVRSCFAHPKKHHYRRAYCLGSMHRVGGIAPFAKPALYSLSGLSTATKRKLSVYSISYTHLFYPHPRALHQGIETRGEFSHETNVKYANYCGSSDKARALTSAGGRTAADAEVKTKATKLGLTSRKSSVTNIQAVLNMMQPMRNQFCRSGVVK